MANQHGLITNKQLVRLDHSPDTIARWVRTGALVLVRRGVYTEPAMWESWDQFRGRPLARSRAAHLMMRTPHVMSHDSAALELDMPILATQPEIIHVTRPDVHGSRTMCGVKHHTAVYREDQVVTIGGIDVLEPARTAVDIAREHGYEAGVVACDSAMRLGVSRAQLRSAYAPMTCWRHVTVVRSAVEFADGRSGSVGESVLRPIVDSLGLGPIETQFQIVIQGQLFCCDLRVGRHLFEFDGKVKYLSRDQGGVATKTPEQVLWDEKIRQDLLCGVGLGMSRIVWSELWGSQREQLRARLRREYAVTEARFGTSLDGLSAYLPRRAA